MNEKEIYEKVGAILKKRRRELGITQEELAFQLGIGVQTLYNYERGIRSLPLNVFFKICDILTINANEISKQVMTDEK